MTDYKSKSEMRRVEALKSAAIDYKSIAEMLLEVLKNISELDGCSAKAIKKIVLIWAYEAIEAAEQKGLKND